MNNLNAIARLLFVFTMVFSCLGCAGKQLGTRGTQSTSENNAPQSDTIELPKLTHFRPALNSEGAPTFIHLHELLEISDLPLDDRTIIESPSKRFLVVEHSWTLDLIAWWDLILHGLDISYHAQGFDCEDYSRAMSLFAELSAVHAGYEGAPVLSGVIVCVMAEAWSGVSAGGLHALVLFHTDEGLFITEPQTGRIVKAADFPADRVYSITLF